MGRARAGYLAFLATPETLRPPEIRTIRQFCQVFGVDLSDLAMFEAEAGFYEGVLNCRTPWIKRWAAVVDSVFRNAEDTTREDQWEWVKRAQKISVFGPLNTIRRRPAGSDDDDEAELEFS